MHAYDGKHSDGQILNFTSTNWEPFAKFNAHQITHYTVYYYLSDGLDMRHPTLHISVFAIIVTSKKNYEQ